MTDPRLPAHQAFDASDQFITVNVGKSKTAFRVYESVLCSSSAFFQARRKPEWAQQGAAIDLPEHSREVFNLYVNWLYMHKIPTATISSAGPEVHQAEYTTLSAAYVLGEAVLDTPFRDSVIDALHAKVRSTSGNSIWSCARDVIKVIYGNTPETSVARKFVTELFVSHASVKEIASVSDVAPKGFYVDIAVAQIHKTHNGPQPLSTFGGYSPEPCKYHCHGGHEQCYLEASKSVAKERIATIDSPSSVTSPLPPSPDRPSPFSSAKRLARGRVSAPKRRKVELTPAEATMG